MARLLVLILLFSLPAFAGSTPTPAQMAAQDAAGKDPCVIVPEVMIPQRPPEFEGVLQWKRTFGVEGLDRAVTILPLADGGFFVVGESRPLVGPDKKPDALQLYILRLDAEGKILFEKRHKSDGLDRIVAATLSKDRLYVLMSAKKNDRSIGRIEAFDGKGEKQKFTVSFDGDRTVFPQDMIMLGDQMLVALWEKNNKNDKDNLSILKRVSLSGKILSEREYLPGVPNRIRSLTRISGGGVLAVGDIERPGGIQAGWVMRLDSRDGIVWQRPYARGVAASLNHGAVLSSGDGFVVVGSSQPSDGKSRAAWIMTLDAQGNPQWQNYMMGDYDYRGEDVTSLQDGRVMMLMNGTPDAQGGRAHARVVTFDAQGRQLSDEAYIEGANAAASRLINFDTARVIAGAAQTGFASKDADEMTRESTYDVWVAALAELKTFDDACRAKIITPDTNTDTQRVP
jgi:hypothetical protein